jgi:acylphosphatase
MERRRIRFGGHVQGVGFRATARAVAASFPVTGWVRNEPDGTVVMEIQGTADDIDACLNTLRERMARFIRHEQADMLPPLPDEHSFVIRR